MCRRREASKVLDVGAAGYLPRGLDVLGVGPSRVGRGLEPYQLVVGQAGCGVSGRARGCARLRCVHSSSLRMWAGSRGAATPAGPLLCSDMDNIRVLHTLYNWFILCIHVVLTKEREISAQTLMEVDGQKLRKLRSRRLWLIGDLATESGVHRNVISKLENDRGGAYPETIRKLAEALGVEPAELIRG